MRIFEIKIGDKTNIIGYPEIVEESGISITEYIDKKYYYKFKTSFKGVLKTLSKTNKKLNYNNYSIIREILDKDKIIYSLSLIMAYNLYSKRITKLNIKLDCLNTLYRIKADYIDNELAYRKYKYKNLEFSPVFELKQNHLGTIYAKCLNVKYSDYNGLRYSRHNINFCVSCNDEIKFYNSTKKLGELNFTNFLFNEKIIKISKETIFKEIEKTCNLLKRKTIITNEDWDLLMLNKLIKNI